MTDQSPRPEAEAPKPSSEPTLDPDTQSILDALDDDLEPQTGDAGTQQLLQSLDAIKPQTVTPAAPASQEEPAQEAPATAEVAPPAAEPPPPPPPIRHRYRVTMTPPAAIQSLIKAAVDEVGLHESVVQANMLWQADFQTMMEDEVIETIERWQQEQLPLNTTLERVYADVFGAQEYIAGWRLAKENKLQAAHHQLTMSLAPLIAVEPTANTVFRTFFAISTAVPAGLFPKLVAHLQQNFECIKWHMATCELRRQVLNDEGKPAADATWEVAHTFGESG